MAVHLEEVPETRTVEVFVTGKLTHEDYEQFMPQLERFMATHGKVRILVQMHDFRGWNAGALWDDVKFDIKHFKDIERLALVGESKWEHGMAVFCKPFTTAEIRYFDNSEMASARDWLRNGTAAEQRAAA